MIDRVFLLAAIVSILGTLGAGVLLGWLTGWGER